MPKPFPVSLFLTLLVLAIGSLCPASAHAEKEPRVSVFDVRQSTVVAVRPLTKTLQSDILAALASDPQVYPGLRLDPEDGWVMRVRFEPAATPGHRFYAYPVREAYLFLARGRQPYALLVQASGFVAVSLRFDPEPFLRWIDDGQAPVSTTPPIPSPHSETE
ncbi:hypothetical protein [Cohnella sp. REN36]|uniref:hypothetical protein n=1 Tax=Cohnella sp. REN36 TaxID=2887347 RepID=UPI001D152F35|nr:hypothetical protein [Cohnella sp. REN36]MCC3371773.1 hypothetical protein [Cohnella sp. REN36]